MRQIVLGYARGTRFGIGRDTDGLLRSGEPGSQLTWMDAKIGDHVVTPRCGKPVEVQALWLNALHASLELSPEFPSFLAEGWRSFEARFYDTRTGGLFDVVDVDHRLGVVDATFRPNQIFAAGGLPFTPLARERARKVVDRVEALLWTPVGLRSLAPGEPAYVGRYEGGVFQRDSAYHQGSVWPWLLGPFVEAWVKTHGANEEAKAQARRRFLEPARAHLSRAGLGHFSEILDGDAPHTPRGCPFQAWSLSELMRLELDVLAEAR
jgi:predicted glycogen debranching enzyme